MSENHKKVIGEVKKDLSVDLQNLKDFISDLREGFTMVMLLAGMGVGSVKKDI